MQRTTAILQASQGNNDILDHKIRVEFWLAKNSNSLLYRMLVLNTGQVPWNLKRQVEVVFNSITKEIASICPNVDLLSDGKRRRNGGQFQSETAIEMYLAFGARKENVDTKERLTDEFVRLDFIEATSDKDFTDKFYSFFDLLAQIDKEFDRFIVPKGKGEEDYSRFTTGRDLFSSQPASVGFITAVAERIFGRPGLDRNQKEIQKELELVVSQVRKMILALKAMDSEQIKNFLDFSTLNETIAVKSSRVSVGEHERTFFKNAFRVLIEEKFDLLALTPAWRV